MFTHGDCCFLVSGETFTGIELILKHILQIYYVILANKLVMVYSKIFVPFVY